MQVTYKGLMLSREIRQWIGVVATAIPVAWIGWEMFKDSKPKAALAKVSEVKDKLRK